MVINPECRGSCAAAVQARRGPRTSPVLHFCKSMQRAHGFAADKPRLRKLRLGMWKPWVRGVAWSHTILCIVFSLIFCNLPIVNKRMPFQIIFALLLGLAVAVGTSLSVVQTSAMTAEMAVGGHSGMAGGNCCPACPDEQHNDNAGCAMTCAICFSAVSADNSGAMILSVPTGPAPGSMASRAGRARTPEPDPPKTYDLS